MDDPKQTTSRKILDEAEKVSAYCGRPDVRADVTLELAQATEALTRAALNAARFETGAL